MTGIPGEVSFRAVFVLIIQRAAFAGQIQRAVQYHCSAEIMNQDRREYTEQLPLAAKLVVRPNEWHIRYYFSGPDMRYSGTSIEIPGNDVAAHIDAFATNWNEYLRLKDQIPLGGSFSIEGQCHMTINIGGYWDGVCIRSHHGAMNTLDKIELAIASYQYAIQRATAVQEAINQLEDPPEFQ